MFVRSARSTPGVLRIALLASQEGLTLGLVREVSWSNVCDKLNIGLFDAAHLLAPLAIASSLGIGHVKVSLTVPFNLALNGNAITVSPTLWGALADAADGDLADPAVSARALGQVVAGRKAVGLPPLCAFVGPNFDPHRIAEHLAAWPIRRA